MHITGRTVLFVIGNTLHVIIAITKFEVHFGHLSLQGAVERLVLGFANVYGYLLTDCLCPARYKMQLFLHRA